MRPDGLRGPGDEQQDIQFPGRETALLELNSPEETADMARSFAKRSRDQKHEHAIRRFEERARNMEEKAVVIREG